MFEEASLASSRFLMSVPTPRVVASSAIDSIMQLKTAFHNSTQDVR